MAQRRMFSNRIANSARFLQMPVESQLLYFHLVLRADDDGIVESYPVTKLLGISPDSFKVLIAKRFIEQLNEDQVVVINEWKEHNSIRADRKVDSIYLPLLLAIKPDADIITPKPRIDVKDNSKRLSGPSTVGISKVRLGKVKLGYITQSTKIKKVQENKTPLKRKTSSFSSIKDITPEVLQDLAAYCHTSTNMVTVQFEKLKNYCEAHGKRYKNYKAALRNFVISEIQQNSRGMKIELGVKKDTTPQISIEQTPEEKEKSRLSAIKVRKDLENRGIIREVKGF